MGESSLVNLLAGWTAIEDWHCFLVFSFYINLEDNCTLTFGYH